MTQRALISLPLLCLALAGTGAAAQAPLQGEGFGWQNAEQVYGKVCAYCHETNIGPVLQGRDLPAVYFSTIVRNGFRAMPAFRESEIDDATLQAVAEFLSASEAREEPEA